MFKAELLRGAETAMIEEAEKLAIAPIDFSSDVLDPKRHQIDQDLRNERPPDALRLVVRIDADRTSDSCSASASLRSK